jgi:cellulose synthase/poly-beta-1,6-N-acetylglucosamine synthase-like glycosyltransferase
MNVVELDASTPMGPSRARNAGAVRLLELDPQVRFIQFVDGDCELADGWISVGIRNLIASPSVAVVCGRLRERFPSASIYNRLCEIEWDEPIGEARFCGGNCMMRSDAFQQVGGFDPNVLAGEEPELCLRLRTRGWKILRTNEEMAVHDAAMTRIGQWWRRAVRSGHAYAQGAWLHGSSPQRHFVRETRRAWGWGFLIPLVAMSAAWPSRGLSLLLLLCYPAQFFSVYRQARRRPLPAGYAAAYAASCMLSKFGEVYGIWKFGIRQLRGAPMQLIEHR